MKMLYFNNSQLVAGLLFLMAVLPFFVIRLGGALFATDLTTSRNLTRKTRGLFMASAIGVILTLSPNVTVAAQEVFVIFRDSGPLVYQVDTVREPRWKPTQDGGPSWSNVVESLRWDRSMFVNLDIRGNIQPLELGTQVPVSSNVSVKGRVMVREGALGRDELKPTEPMSFSHVGNPMPTSVQRLVQQDHPAAQASMPN